MYLSINESSLQIGPRFELNDFPLLIEMHEKLFPGGAIIEQDALRLIENDFEITLQIKFIKKVCRWGNYSGISGKVLKHNSAEDITQLFRAANRCLNLKQPQVDKALKCINSIKGLGTPSFASKHLRFLKPSACPVYDSILNERLPYTYDAFGYAEFAKNCSDIAYKLIKEGIENPLRETWLVADVERAMFASFYKTKKEKSDVSESTKT